MRHVVEGVLLVHYRRHPHVLLFQTPDGSFKLFSILHLFQILALSHSFLINQSPRRCHAM